MRRITPATVLSIVALSIALGTAGGPVVAAAFDAKNADKVDGRHAVGAAATPAQRARKLVATNGAGRLPNTIIAKAPDADRLDGLDSKKLQFPAVIPSGVTVRGAWGIDTETTGTLGDHGIVISLPARSPVPLVGYWMDAGTPANANCPGSSVAPEAAPGKLCVYRFTGGGFNSATAPTFACNNQYGCAVRFKDDGVAGDAFANGAWAYTAP